MNDTILLKNLIEIEEFHYQKNETVTSHSSLWGDFNFSLNGLLEFYVDERVLLSPPSYGLWIPPQTEHCCIAVDQQLTHYICIRIHASLCHLFDGKSKTLSISPFLRHTVLELLEQKRQSYPSASYQQHLLQVLLDQLQMAPCHDQYLPQSTHPVLEPLLKQLADPALFSHSLQQLSAPFKLSERHLLRISQQDIQMSLSEWRNRAKIIYAMTQLRHGSSIKKLALELGYMHSSGFIEFFKRYTGKTPSQVKDV